MSHLVQGLATVMKQEFVDLQNYPLRNTFVHFPTEQQARRPRSRSWPSLAKWTAMISRKAAEQGEGEEISLQRASKETCYAVSALQIQSLHDFDEVDGVELPVVWSDLDEDESPNEETQPPEVDSSEPQQFWPDTDSESSDYDDERYHADVNCQRWAVAGHAGHPDAVGLSCTNCPDGDWHYNVPAAQAAAMSPVRAASTASEIWAEQTPTGHNVCTPTAAWAERTPTGQSWPLLPHMQQNLPEHQAVPMPGQHLHSFLAKDPDRVTGLATVPMMHLSPKPLSTPVLQVLPPTPSAMQASTVPEPATLRSPALFSSSAVSQLPGTSPPQAVSSHSVSRPAVAACPMTHPAVSVSPFAASAPVVCPPPQLTPEGKTSVQKETVAVDLCGLLGDKPAPLPRLLGRLGAGSRSCHGSGPADASKAGSPPGLFAVEEGVKPVGLAAMEEVVKPADPLATEEMSVTGYNEIHEQQITTLMVRNLPTNIVQQELVEELDRSGFKGLYDFCYLPKNFTVRESKGFAFINFTSAQFAGQFVGRWHKQRKWGMDNTVPALNISPATLQGLAANKQKWAGGRFKRIRNPNLRPYLVEDLDPDASAEPKALGCEAWQ